MMNGKRNLLLIISVCFLLGACSKIRQTEAEKEREEWISGFNDSISFYSQKSQKLQDTLNVINSKIASLMSEFEKVENPREVAGYYIFKGWSKKIPMVNTSLYARINENEGFEMIATLQGATFNQIGVNTPDGKIISDIVRHDQAFNYRHQRYNTVYFSGEKADSIAQYIANNYSDKIKLDFFEGKLVKSFSLPDSEKEMITRTWNLYSLQKNVKNLQKDYWISSKKIETFRHMLDDYGK